MLDEAIKYLEAQTASNKAFSYEILVVSDGSRDKTVEVAQGYSLALGSNKLRVLDLKQNRGKGGAVRLVCLLLIFLILITFIQIFDFIGNAECTGQVLIVC